MDNDPVKLVIEGAWYFCTKWDDGNYATVARGPCPSAWISYPFRALTVNTEGECYFGASDRIVYLLNAENVHNGELPLEMRVETIPFVTVIDSTVIDDLVRMFTPEVEELFDYKIENGKLYERDDEGEYHEMDV